MEDLLLFLTLPHFWIPLLIFIFVVASFYYWGQKDKEKRQREKEQEMLERIRNLEEKVQKKSEV